jgi:SAM-dependent methyltransferase
MNTPAPRFQDLTETTGISVTREGAQMLYSRYRFAADRARDKRVLELGCAAGQGFGLLARQARQLIGGDYSMELLRSAQSHYGDRVPLARLSASRLPFRDRSFDLIVFFEASYYVPDMNAAFDEIARILAPGGEVLFVNANPQRADFIRSPHSVHYHTADEFREALRRRAFDVSVEGAFPVASRGGLFSRVAALAAGIARRALETFHLTPKTLRGRARLKRLVYGKLPTVPPEVPEDFSSVAPRTRLGDGPQPGHKVLYVSGRKG